MKASKLLEVLVKVNDNFEFCEKQLINLRLQKPEYYNIYGTEEKYQDLLEIKSKALEFWRRKREKLTKELINAY